MKGFHNMQRGDLMARIMLACLALIGFVMVACGDDEGNEGFKGESGTTPPEITDPEEVDDFKEVEEVGDTTDTEPLENGGETGQISQTSTPLQGGVVQQGKLGKGGKGGVMQGGVVQQGGLVGKGEPSKGAPHQGLGGKGPGQMVGQYNPGQGQGKGGKGVHQGVSQFGKGGKGGVMQGGVAQGGKLGKGVGQGVGQGYKGGTVAQGSKGKKGVAQGSEYAQNGMEQSSSESYESVAMGVQHGAHQGACSDSINHRINHNGADYVLDRYVTTVYSNQVAQYGNILDYAGFVTVLFNRVFLVRNSSLASVVVKKGLVVAEALGLEVKQKKVYLKGSGVVLGSVSSGSYTGTTEDGSSVSRNTKFDFSTHGACLALYKASDLSYLGGDTMVLVVP